MKEMLSELLKETFEGVKKVFSEEFEGVAKSVSEIFSFRATEGVIGDSTKAKDSLGKIGSNPKQAMKQFAGV